MWAQFFAVVCSPRPKRGRQNAPGAAIVCRARGCPGLALLFVLVRSMPNRPLSIARQAQAAISLIAKNQHSSTKTAGSSKALATSTGQRTRLDRAHGGTHPAKSWPPERARRGHRLPGKGLPWAGAAFRPGAFYAKSASKPRQASASSYLFCSALAVTLPPCAACPVRPGPQTVQAFARPRLTASRSKALMRVCQPGPVALNASNTSASTRIFRVGRLERFHAWALSRVTATRRPAAPSTASNVLTVGLPFGPSAR